MRFLNIWQGFRLSTISAWFHLSFLMAGLCIDTSGASTMSVDGVVILTRKQQIFHYYCSVGMHGIMTILMVLCAVFTTFGRHVNMKAKLHEHSNGWLFLSLYIEMTAVFLYLFFIINVNVHYIVAQLCPFWNYLQPDCWSYYSQLIAYMVYESNAYIAYLFGIVKYIVCKMIFSSLMNKHVTEAQKQFTDFLVLRQREARWIGNGISCIVVPIMALITTKKNLTNAGLEKDYFGNAWILYTLLVVEILKFICFQPMNTTIMPTEEEQLALADADVGDLTIQQKADWWGVSLEGTKDVWYVIKRYRIRARLWFMWPIIMGTTFATLCVYIFQKKQSAATESIAPCCWILMFSTFFQMLHYIKLRLMEKWRHLYWQIPCHEREVLDPTLEYLTPMQITEKTLKMYGNLDSGNDIIAAGYKSCHIPTQEKMGYTLEMCLQTQYTMFFTLGCQAFLCFIFFMDYIQQQKPSAETLELIENCPSFGEIVVAADEGLLSGYTEAFVMPSINMSDAVGRIFCTMVLHVNTEKFVRQGLEMMKYAINHPDHFSTPVMAAIIGLIHCTVQILLTFAIILNISNQGSFLDVLTAFATYIQTTMIPVHTLNQLPVGACLKKAAPPLQIEEHRRYIETRRCEFWILRSIYKIYRWFFGGFWFYFLPFLPLYLPWVIIVIRQRCPTFYYPIFVN